MSGDPKTSNSRDNPVLELTCTKRRACFGIQWLGYPPAGSGFYGTIRSKLARDARCLAGSLCIRRFAEDVPDNKFELLAVLRMLGSSSGIALADKGLSATALAIDMLTDQESLARNSQRLIQNTRPASTSLHVWSGPFRNYDQPSW